jgi:hypothetical protein
MTATTIPAPAARRTGPRALAVTLASIAAFLLLAAAP